jgi:hypothetical protein
MWLRETDLASVPGVRTNARDRSDTVGVAVTVVKEGLGLDAITN